MLKDLASQIVKHTVLSRKHLTPELAIRVVDQTCALWTLSSDCTSGPDQWPEQWPFKDPFWAFYWPGGQATARNTMLKDLASIIVKHTVVSQRHLTPELIIRIIDQNGPLWMAREDRWPFKDPFWGLYWPGGQVTTRYILDNENIVKNRRVLDVGCGCGASSIASVKMKAKRVVANDIDPYAVAAAGVNAEANQVKLEVSDVNMIGSKCEEFDTILVGDLFYEPEFADKLFQWLTKLNDGGKTVLIGDPGRHGLTDRMREQITLLSTYRLNPETCLENHGFVDASVWKVGLDSTKK